MKKICNYFKSIKKLCTPCLYTFLAANLVFPIVYQYEELSHEKSKIRLIISDDLFIKSIFWLFISTLTNRFVVSGMSNELIKKSLAQRGFNSSTDYFFKKMYAIKTFIRPFLILYILCIF